MASPSRGSHMRLDLLTTPSQEALVYLVYPSARPQFQIHTISPYHFHCRSVITPEQPHQSPVQHSLSASALVKISVVLSRVSGLYDSIRRHVVESNGSAISRRCDRLLYAPYVIDSRGCHFQECADVPRLSGFSWKSMQVFAKAYP